MALIEVIKQFFEEEAWPVTSIPASNSLGIQFQGDNGRWGCLAHALEEQRQFVFYSVYPFSVPPEKRPAVTEFLTRANTLLSIGNLEMDYSDGEVRFRTSIDVEGDELSKELVRNIVYINVMMADHFFAGLLSVIYSDSSPVEALAVIEQDSPSIIP